MRVLNSSHLSTKFIKDVIKWIVLPEEISKIKSLKVFTKKGIANAGLFDPRSKRIFISVGDGKEFPCYRGTTKQEQKHGYRKFLFHSPEEAFVATLAHELRHSFQDFISTRRWYTKPTDIAHCDIINEDFPVFYCLEHDADEFAHKVLKKWRSTVKLWKKALKKCDLKQFIIKKLI